MREIPQDLIPELTSFTMVLRAVWGMSWEVELLKNPRFCYMEKHGWEKFVNDNALGESEFLTFTHKGDMSFNVNIFQQNGKEMICPRVSLASSSRIKTEQEDDVLNYLGSRTADSTGGAKSKRELNLEKKKAVRTDSAGPTMPSSPKFTVVIKKSNKHVITIPKQLAEDNQLWNEVRVFKINHANGKKSWEVECVSRIVASRNFTRLSKGWSEVFRQYPINIGDTCEFTLTKPTEMVLVVFKA